VRPTRSAVAASFPSDMPPPPRTGIPAQVTDLPRTGLGGAPGALARTHLLVAVGVGVVAGVLASVAGGSWPFALLLGWLAAVREDPGRAVMDALVLVSAVASLAAVGLLLTSTGHDPDVRAALSVGSVAVAWAAVHTTFATRYARLYYAGPDDGIDFNSDEPPAYTDFAYLAFTIGMTFQVSDTAIRAKTIRATALRHALLSFLLGTVVIAATINLLAGLGR
jgi:uncharacterized membrane protein